MKTKLTEILPIGNLILILLCRQELVGSGGYFARNVTVTTPGGKQLQARTYQETVDPPKLKEGELLPEDRRPSNTYLGVTLILFRLDSGISSMIPQYTYNTYINIGYIDIDKYRYILENSR